MLVVFNPGYRYVFFSSFICVFDGLDFYFYVIYTMKYSFCDFFSETNEIEIGLNDWKKSKINLKTKSFNHPKISIINSFFVFLSFSFIIFIVQCNFMCF